MPRVARLTFLLLVLLADACFAQQSGYADRAVYREPAPSSFDPFADDNRYANHPAAVQQPTQPTAQQPYVQQSTVQQPFAQPRTTPPAESEPAPLPATQDARYLPPAPFQNYAEIEQPQTQPQPPARSAVQQAALNVVEEEPRPLHARKPEKLLPLAPPSKLDPKSNSARGTPSLITLLTSLTLVLGLFSVAAWVVKRGMPKSMNLLPAAAVEVLGRIPIAARQQAYLVRVGGKMLLVSATPGGMETLTEITDPVEVDRLAGICQQSRKNSSSREFKQVLQDFDTEPAPKTFVGAAVPQIDFSTLGAVNTSSRGGRHG